MDSQNNIIIFLFENAVLISKNEIKANIYLTWFDLKDLSTSLLLEGKQLKYFDDENDLVSLICQDDFIIFKELLLNKKFHNHQLIMVAYDNVFNYQNFFHLEKLLDFKNNSSFSESFVRINSNSSSHGDTHSNARSLQQYHYSDCDSTTSTSSPSEASGKHKTSIERSKKYSRISRYAAELRKELNYLTGSEVYDGETIVKRWRVKNVGSKKWKENAVKSVLLPSRYSGWISSRLLPVPLVFADQKTALEMEIRLAGRWEEDCLDGNGDSDWRKIDLTWLLFMDGLVHHCKEQFKEHILARLQLNITVHKNNQDTGTLSENQDHLSESSIERVDQDFSIVNPSPDVSNPPSPMNPNKTISTADIEIELPECPKDDFAISDLNDSHNRLSMSGCDWPASPEQDGRSPSLLSMLNEPDFLGRIRSTREDLGALKLPFDDIDASRSVAEALRERFGVNETLGRKEECQGVIVEEAETSKDANNHKNINENKVYLPDASENGLEVVDTSENDHNVLRNGDVNFQVSDTSEMDRIVPEVLDTSVNQNKDQKNNEKELYVSEFSKGERNALKVVDSSENDNKNQRTNENEVNVSESPKKDMIVLGGFDTSDNKNKHKNGSEEGLLVPGTSDIDVVVSDDVEGLRIKMEVTRRLEDTEDLQWVPPEALIHEEEHLVDINRQDYPGYPHEVLSRRIPLATSKYPVVINNRTKGDSTEVFQARLQELKDMGFLDEERNRRLLIKFDNMNDVISDLVD